MAEEKTLYPSLDETTVDGKKLHNSRQWLERFRHYIKQVHEIEIGNLIREDESIKTWNREQTRRYVSKRYFKKPDQHTGPDQKR